MSNYLVEYNVTESDGDWVSGIAYHKIRIVEIMSRKQVVKLLKNKYSDVIKITKLDTSLISKVVKLIDEENENENHR